MLAQPFAFAVDGGAADVEVELAVIVPAKTVPEESVLGLLTGVLTVEAMRHPETW